MDPFALKPAEKTLFEAIQDGREADFTRPGEDTEPGESNELRAEAIRHIVLGLPFVDEGGFLRATAALFGAPPRQRSCLVTGVGIAIKGGVIKGRLTLDSIIGDEGGAIDPLAFEGTCFEDGFSGAHGHFSRLQFRDCRFGDQVDPLRGKAPQPSIDLIDAAVDSDLDLTGCRPWGDEASSGEADRAYFEDPGRPSYEHCCWIRLAGARIDGDVDLSGARLRRPRRPAPERGAAQPPAPADEPPPTPTLDALNLSRAEIAGDLRFLGGRALGRVIARRAQIGGDIWMTGACLNGDGCEALVLQSATVAGFVVLRGAYSTERTEDVHARFAARGEINFHGARLGSKLRIGDADLYASCAPLAEMDACAVDGISPSEEDSDVCLCLEGARVDGSLNISAQSPRKPSLLRGRLQLAYLEVANEMHMLNLSVGPGGQEQNDATIDARLLVAKEILISGINPSPPAAGAAAAQSDRRTFIDLDGAKVDALKIEGSHLDGAFSARSLECRRDVQLDVRVDGRVDLASANVRGSLDMSRLTIRAGSNLSLRGATIARALKLRSGPERETDDDAAAEGAATATPARSGFSMCGDVDLKGLSCDTLDDEAGLAWGRQRRIKMNHFVYRQADWHYRPRGPVRLPLHRILGDWLSERRAERRRPWRWIPELLLKSDRRWSPQAAARRPRHRVFGDWLAARRAARRWPWRWIPERILKSDRRWTPRTTARTPSHLIVGNWMAAKRGEGRLPWRLLPAFMLPKGKNFWEPWQVRRSWIYQQFDTGKDLDKICRHRIGEAEYRPQPFEQAIRVARAEGHEDFATQFEMLKHKIEWQLFNRKVRWWLGFAGIALGTFWVVRHQPPIDGSHFNWGLLGGTGVALVASLVLMVFASTVYRALCWAIPLKPGRFHKLLSWGVFFLPVYVLYKLSDWDLHSFHFLIGLLIFLVIRFISEFAFWVMRFGFGYLLRPVRAIITLILAFLLGWWGVHLANSRNMLVVNAQPVADLAGPDRHARFPAGYAATGTPILMGSERVEAGPRFARELSCAATVSEPLYALDVLAPIVDLGEESRCEVRRVAEPRPAVPAAGGSGHAAPAAGPHRGKAVEDMNFDDLREAMPDLALNDHGFWWWMRALYAIAGWIIVSLSILTFAQANRTHAEPPGEKH